MVIKRDIYYPPADSNRKLHIYIPGNYYQSDERYPVMYMFDGHNLFFDWDATYGKSWGFYNFLESWDKPMILVGMECSHIGDQRLNEYSPYTRHMFGRDLTGMGDQTFQWLIHDIKPMIDREYRTYPQRLATGLGGSSMGGIMTVYGMIRYNSIFSKGAAVSTGVYWNIADFRADLKKSSVEEDTRLYLSWGELESGRAPHGGSPEYDTREAKSVYRLEAELQAKGMRTYHYFQWGGGRTALRGRLGKTGACFYELAVERSMKYCLKKKRADARLFLNICHINICRGTRPDIAQVFTATCFRLALRRGQSQTHCPKPYRGLASVYEMT